MPLIAEPIKAVDGNVADRDQVAATIKEVGRNRDTPFGSISFDQNTRNVTPLYLRRVEIMDGRPGGVLVEHLPSAREEEVLGWRRG